MIATSGFVALWVTSRTLLAFWPDPSVSLGSVRVAPLATRAALPELVPASLTRSADDRPKLRQYSLRDPEIVARVVGRTAFAASLVVLPASASKAPEKRTLAQSRNITSPFTIAAPSHSDQHKQPAMEVPLALTPTSPAPTGHLDSLRVSTWGLFRPGPSRRALLSNGQLGGSQIGARFGFPIVTASKSISIDTSARAYAPIGSRRGKEAAVGISLRKSGTPSLELLAERRIGLDRDGRNAFSITAITGVSDLALDKGFTLNAYAQGGVVGARARDGFIDGSAVVDRPLNTSRIRVGAGAWGGIQPGLARLDVGPQASVSLPVDRRAVRLSAQWRFRVAGRAAPASGPAIVIGSDF